MGISKKRKNPASGSKNNNASESISSPQLDQKELRTLETLFSEKKYEELEKRLSHHIEKFPAAYFLYNILGLTQAGQGKYSQAVSSYQKVINFQPEHAGAHCNMGLAFLQLGHFSNAIGSFKKALKYEPEFKGIYKNLGVALNNLGRFEEAVTNYRMALEQDSGDAELYRNLGIAYDNLGNSDDAVFNYCHALRLNPDDAVTLGRLGGILLKRGQLSEAVECFRKALEFDPESFESAINLGTAYNNLDRFEESISMFEQAVKLNPGSAKAHSSLGSALLNLNRHEEALHNYDKALELDSENPEAHYSKGLVHEALRQDQSAIDCYQKALEIRPDYPDALSRLGLVYNNIGQHEEAIACHDRVVELAPDDVKSHYYLGFGYTQLNRQEAAIKCFRKAIEMKPDFINAYINLGTSYRNLGDGFQAIQIYQQALEIDPESELALRHFAEAVRSQTRIKITPNLRKHVIACFASTSVASIAVNPVANMMLKHDLQSLIKSGDVRVEHIERLHESTEGLLFHYLKYSFITDFEIEKILIRIRSCLLRLAIEDAKKASTSETLLPILEGLAFQGFLNEYVWYSTDEEIALLGAVSDHVDKVISDGNAPDITDLYILAAYVPLNSLPHVGEWGVSAYENAGPELKEILRKQIIEPEREKVIAQDIEQLTGIDDDISASVQSQYEENPYPRWDSISTYIPILYTQKICEEISYNSGRLEAVTDRPAVLIAGCGTGKQPISAHYQYRNSSILAVDLSRASLAYAKRKSDELGIRSIRFAQADILKLGIIKRKFDIVECGGVLHHMKEPEKGLEVLLGLLRPDGFLKLGLYSTTARQAIADVRKSAAAKAFETSTRGIQLFRHQLLFDRPDITDKFSVFNDWYTISTFRDLLMHVQEHTFTIPQLEVMLDKFSLEFLGFVTSDLRIKLSYKQMFPDDKNCSNLKHWHEFETINPSTFVGMYQFWCRPRVSRSDD